MSTGSSKEIKFGYLVQRSIVSRAALNAIQTIIYKFIWGAQKEVAWKNMIKTKKQGGMGVRDYKTTQMTAIVDKACRMWEGNGIWSAWMCKRYVKERPMSLIEKRQGDSSAWKSTLRHRDQIAKCASLRPNKSKTWIGKGGGNSIKNSTTTLRPKYPKDVLAKGIWANRIGKVALNLGRVW